MHKVITISLNNKAYQFEEPGYHALHAYLERAANKLTGNPDKDEIMADLEQAIADKCAAYLNTSKNVVTQKEAEDILAAMGPVEGWEGEESGNTSEAGKAPKRLFKIREGAVFEGVCNGIAAYFNLDATLVRVIFIVLAILTAGTWIIAYILMAIFIPEARTPAERAAAKGQPFTTKTLMDEAHKRYEELKAYSKEQKQKWEAKEAAHRAAVATTPEQKTPTTPAEKPNRPSAWARFAQGFAGFLGGIGSLILLGLGIVWILALVDIFTKGTVLGYFAGAALPVLALFISCLFYLIFLPLQAIVGDAFRYAQQKEGGPSFWGRIFTVILWFIIVSVIGYIVQQSPPIQDGLKNVRTNIERRLAE